MAVETSNRFTFTEERLAKKTCPPSGKPEKNGQLWLYDDKTRGLAYLVTETGGRSFYWYRRITGRTSPMRRKLDQSSVVLARREVERLNGQIDDKGTVPLTTRDELAKDQQQKQDAATVGILWTSYHDHHLINKKPGTVAEFTRLYDAHLAAWKDRLAADITLADVETLKIHVGTDHGHYTANRVLAILSSIYRKRGHAFNLPRAWSPTAGVEPFPEMPRDRVLTVDELSKVLKAIDADDNTTARDYFKMLLYTGMRKTAVATMAWDHLNIPGGTWKLPGATTKNGKPLVVNLIPEAIAIIKRRYDDNPSDSPFVFPARRITPGQAEAVQTRHAAGESTHVIAEAVGIAQTTVMGILKPGYVARPASAFDGAGVAWTRILKRAGISQRTTIHDLRRTFCTAMIERGVPLPIVSAAMGHRTMETTQRHYSIASDKAVGDATRTSMAGLLADVAKAGEVQENKGKRKGAA